MSLHIAHSLPVIPNVRKRSKRRVAEIRNFHSRDYDAKKRRILLLNGPRGN